MKKTGVTEALLVGFLSFSITGNSHFMFRELNNDVIANHIAIWLESRGLN